MSRGLAALLCPSGVPRSEEWDEDPSTASGPSGRPALGEAVVAVGERRAGRRHRASSPAEVVACEIGDAQHVEAA